MYDPRKHPQWSAVREAIKQELVSECDGAYEPFKPWSAGWGVPVTDDMADAMLNGLADVAIEAVDLQKSEQE